MPQPAITFPAPDAYLEATGDGVRKRVQAANRAAQDVVKDRNATEREAVQKLQKRLMLTKISLQARLFAKDGGLTDFRQFSLNALVADVDRLIEDTQRDVADGAKTSYSRMGDLGDAHAEEPMRAAGLTIRPELPGLDALLVNAAFDNTLELLTQPMQQFASTAKVLIRGVTLAGDQKFEAIQKLRDHISGQGFDNAQYRAERIIRTELGRTFNQATYDRMVGLSKDFPFLRKGWRAAGDSRTRMGHRQAAQTYGRGHGIPMADLFELKVYDERPGKGAKYLGTATLRFPLDPLVKPEGRIGAAATIMCRCNAFVDFDLADFAEFSRKAIQLAVGGVLPPISPGPQPVPAPTQAPAPKVRKPRTVKPKPAPALTAAPMAAGPTAGPKVSAALLPATERSRLLRAQPATKALVKVRDKVLAAIDAVHSDGALNPLRLFSKSSQKFYGAYQPGHRGTAIGMYLTPKGTQAHPLNTLTHEIGHWLDHQVIGRGGRGLFSKGDLAPGLLASDNAQGTNFDIERAGHSVAMRQWLEATQNSDTIKRLKSWQGMPQPDVNPVGVNRKHLDYLLTKREVWARSYAQYIAVRSGDTEMLAELRKLQRSVTSGPVPSGAKYNLGILGKDEPTPGSWDYPTVWQDDEFEPIAKAFDQIFEGMGWRKGPGQ